MLNLQHHFYDPCAQCLVLIYCSLGMRGLAACASMPTACVYREALLCLGQALVRDDALWILTWAKAESAGTTVPLLNLGPVLQVAAQGQQVCIFGQLQQPLLLFNR